MSGTYGYDGYIYQTNVICYLIIDELIDKNGSLSSFFLEVRKKDRNNARKNDFNVDLILVADNDINAMKVFEIKGGKEAKVNKIIKNFKRINKFLKNSGFNQPIRY